MASKARTCDKGNVQTDDTASRSETSGFGDVPEMFSEATQEKEDVTIEDLLKDREVFMKEQLKVSEDLRKFQVRGYKDMMNEMRQHFHSFLDIAEKKLNTVIEPQFTSTPAENDDEKYKLPDPLQKRDQHEERDEHQFHGSFLQETPENSGARPKKKNESIEERERTFEALLRIIEERQHNGPQPRGQGGQSQTGGPGRRGDNIRAWESGMS